MTEVTPELAAAEEALERFVIAAGQSAEADRIERTLTAGRAPRPRSSA